MHAQYRLPTACSGRTARWPRSPCATGIRGHPKAPKRNCRTIGNICYLGTPHAGRLKIAHRTDLGTFSSRVHHVDESFMLPSVVSTVVSASPASLQVLAKSAIIPSTPTIKANSIILVFGLVRIQGDGQAVPSGTVRRVPGDHRHAVKPEPR